MHGSIKALAPGVLFLTGLYLYAARADVRRCWRIAWPVMGATGLYVLHAVANTAGHGFDWAAVDGPAHILMYMAIAAVFAAGLQPRITWIGFSLTAIASGLLCIVQHFGWHAPRASSLDGGASTAIEFATLMLCLALLALVQLLRTHANRWEQGIHAAGLVLGVYGALLTQSRGPLLAFVPAFVLLLILHARQRGHWRGLLWGTAILVIGCALAMTTLHGAMLKRFGAIDQQLAAARTGQVTGSVSARVAMWRTAMRAFGEHPLAGLGPHRFQGYLRAEAATGRTSAAVTHYNNPHDMYLGAAASGGIPGLLVLLGVLLAPLVFFARHAGARDETEAVAAWSGFAVVVLYMLCALTDSVFYRILTLSLYFFLVLGLAMLVASRRSIHGAGPSEALARFG